MRAALYLVMAVTVASLAAPSRSAPTPTVRELRTAKCRFLWQRVNPATYEQALADWFVDRHAAAGVGEDWTYSFIYCWSGSDLDPKMVSGDTLGGYHARGLVDTLWSTHSGNHAAVASTLEARGLTWNEQVLHDPYVAVRLHLIEWLAYRDPQDPWHTMRRVFLPGSPDGGRAYQEQHGRWEPRMARAEVLLAEGYRKGLLP